MLDFISGRIGPRQFRDPFK